MSENSPYTNGAGRYPNRLYASVAIEFAVVRLSSYTDASMKLTSGAMMVAPKKKTHHSKR